MDDSSPSVVYGIETALPVFGSDLAPRLKPEKLAAGAPEIVAADGDAIVVSAGLGGRALGGLPIKDVRVLVVDDDVATQDAVSEVLKGMGAEVRVAESAAAAMAAVAAFRPQLLLCDIAMPGEDGHAFIRRVRLLGADGGGGMPALALTALATDDDRERSLAAGFQMHLTKPVDLERLSEAVVQLAGRQQVS
jgi:CheY-like chemotaxis protein